MTDATPQPAAAATPAPAATPTPAAAPAATPAASGQPPAATPSPTPAAQPTPESGWKVPDAHKDKPWAAKVKSQEDVYKQLDNLTALAGKKHATPDFKTAAPEEIEEFFNGLRPAEKTAYKFGDEGSYDPEFAGGVSDVLFNAGVPEHIANKLIPAYAAFEQTKLAEATSADGFKAEMNKRFGEQYDAVVAANDTFLKANLDDDSKKLVDAMPNQYIGVLYDVLAKKDAEIAKLKKEHGINDTGSPHTENPTGSPAPVDIGKVRAELRTQIAAIDARPHTQAEKQALVDKLQATYNNQGK